MADVLRPVRKGREGKRAFNEISQKHLDFVICRSGTWAAIAGAVELNDASHRRKLPSLVFFSSNLYGSSLPDQ